VRYSVEAEPILTVVCHCTDCQKQAGAAFSIEFGVPLSAVTVQGTTKTFHGKGDSGKAVERRFCPECGSALISWGAAMPDALWVKAGTLDDTKWLSPTMEIYCDSAQPWVRLASDMKKFPKAPCFDEVSDAQRK
jgi:hypothetical protein